MDCGKPPALPQGSAELLTGTTHLGSVVQYSCAAGYRLVGPARRTCAEDFQWSESTPTCEGLPCKDESLNSYDFTQYYSLLNESLNPYVTVKRNSNGQRTYSEIHFAAQADREVSIWLSNNENDPDIRCNLWIGEEGNQKSSLYYKGRTVQNINTPDVLSSTQFRAFYIKIYEGMLQFGKEGDSTPLLSYSDADFRLLNNYLFKALGGPGKIHFCPADDKGSS